MNFKTWLGLSVLAVGSLSILSIFYRVMYEPGLQLNNDPFADYILMWGIPIQFKLDKLSEYPTLLATLLLCICALIFVITGRALKMLAFLCALMFTNQGTRLLVGIFNFVLLPERTAHDLQLLLPPSLMIGISYCVLRMFQRAWDGQSVSGGAFVATPVVRFYGYVVDLVIIQTLVHDGPYNLSLLPYGWAVALLSYVLYYAVFEHLFLFTPGKLLLNTRVCMENGTVPPEGTIILRTLARLIPFEPLSCLYNEGWHDKLSKTKVIRHPWAGGLVTTG
ncbi:hypothetical protein KK062_24775 [Fulvivirgaceae bacterium PWU5]|uniref:RDD domain-containing protein n=1 Tax=Dawidia cretensis TaxID=2782350 RepID=A0AAP2E1X6_9BACT|nr:RDD family protein [Dawidia cretensis]MBT1711481.1 hypothetical protein [Dawidia cretensis]